MTEMKEDKPKRTTVLNWKSFLTMMGLSIGSALFWKAILDRPKPTPNCTNLVSEVLRISKEKSPSDIKVVKVLEPTTITQEPEHIECTGTAVLSNGEQAPMGYRLQKEYNKWRVSFEPL